MVANRVEGGGAVKKMFHAGRRLIASLKSKISSRVDSRFAEIVRQTLPSALKAVQKKKKKDALSKAKSYGSRAALNGFPYSFYAYGMYNAAFLAKKLGMSEIAVIEFGVAGGNGLVAMEAHADAINKELGVSFQIYGFDTGEGLTPPQDHRDMPYRFKEGNYKMNVPKLKERLNFAELILGDVKETVRKFLHEKNPPPIGFISFDLDYYSSTMDAFKLISGGCDETCFLPRMHCYFDDIIGDVDSSYNEFVGELAAISDFNDKNRNVKIAKSRVFLREERSFAWYHQIYLIHRFQHPQYGVYISSASSSSLSLKD